MTHFVARPRTKINKYLIKFILVGAVCIYLFSHHLSIEWLMNDLEKCSSKLSGKRYLIDLPYWDKTQLIDLTNFEYISVCQVCDDSVKLLVMIMSAAWRLKIRDDIRKTYGTNRPRVKVLFLLGAVENATLQSLIDFENFKYRDIVQGNFIDTYRNLTYKHMMGLKYMLYFCPEVKYTVKVDDDVYLHIDHVLIFVDELQYFSDRKDRLFCWIHYKREVPRNISKWAVSREEYSEDFYPIYCSGPIVMYDYDVAFRLYKKTQESNYYWIEDVLITGIVAGLEGIKFFDLNYVLFNFPKDIEMILNDTSRWKIYFGFWQVRSDEFERIHKIIKSRKWVKKSIVKFLYGFQNKSLY